MFEPKPDRSMLTPHSALWREKAMTYVKLSRTTPALSDKRRCLTLAAKCMRYSVRLDRRARTY